MDDDDDRGAEGEEVEAEETGEEEEWELARYSGGRWRAFLAKFKLRSLRREWMLLMVARRAKVVYLSFYVPTWRRRSISCRWPVLSSHRRK